MLYRIFQPELTPLDPVPWPWTWVAGFCAGLLTGAYNTPGPPVVIYADACSWEKDRFRVNLQSFFIFCSAFTLIGHLLQGSLTKAILLGYGWVLIGIVGGMAAGIALDKYIPADLFRRLVQLLLLVIGGTMIWSIF